MRPTFAESFAFPGESEYGLTKRELFAAMAMQGLIQEYAIRGIHPGVAANRAVICADALIAELNKDPIQHSERPL